ncbi:hypothetical protein PoB_006561300 [Plakobranchus ocellatus]|uniref:TGF-beta family profile domain-containing protein n=1 Tax=Plakobranchus ocellatus TaxID=259542 RepID=A0AAV4D4N3_9GAST|nr:hypothetical protein PoB_006561300 [Plakobranchus ocellatus]
MKCSQTWAKTSTGEAKEPVENWRRQCVDFGWATQNIWPTTGTVSIRGAFIFDLTTATATAAAASNHHSLNISMNPGCCSAAQICQSMLFEYCNINATVTARFKEGVPTHDSLTDVGADHVTPSRSTKVVVETRRVTAPGDDREDCKYADEKSCISGSEEDKIGSGKSENDSINMGYNDSINMSFNDSINMRYNGSINMGFNDNIKMGFNDRMNMNHNHSSNNNKSDDSSSRIIEGIETGNDASSSKVNTIGRARSDSIRRSKEKTARKHPALSAADLRRLKMFKKISRSRVMKDSVIGPRIKAGIPRVKISELGKLQPLPSLVSWPSSRSSPLSSHSLPTLVSLSSSSSLPSLSSSSTSSLSSSLLLSSPSSSSPAAAPSLSSSSPSLSSSSSPHSSNIKLSPSLGSGRFRRDNPAKLSQRTNRSPKRTCERGKLTVDLFHDLHLPVLMPTRPVDLGQCCGTCIHASHMGQIGDSLTAHAVVLNRLGGTEGAVRRWGPAMRMSSCVPHRMRTMSILLSRVDKFNVFGTEIVNWPNMVIVSCRCA